MLWPFQTVNSLSIVGFFPSYQNHSQHLHFVPSLHRQCAILPWVSSISGDKQIHPLRCLQQGNPHHPSPSMPFYRPPPNDRSRIALGWFKEFQWSWIKGNSFCHLRGYLRVTIPKVSHCHIMATQPSLCWNHSPPPEVWNCCLPSEPSSSVPLHSFRCELHVSAREMLLWLTLWVDPKLIDLREDRFFRSCPFSSCCHASWSSQSKTTGQRWWSNQRSCEVHPGSWRIVLVCIPPSSYPTLESRDEILV